MRGVLRHVRKAQGLRVPNPLPEHAAPARQRTDAATGLLVDPRVDEALELLLALVENAQCGVPRARELPGRLEHVAEHGLDIGLRDQRSPDIEQLPELHVAQFQSVDPTARGDGAPAYTARDAPVP